ncbi:hypothetical protein C7122_03720 [Lachnospiraceae bacterium oral taxon 096]|nr:hypothetical protein C7122_03720 [Lachnospiraceae bacterium oral taxon 096]QUI95658.1 hypothetical protein J5A74_09845 [Lachnospiraceae bacterium oral taxon 096]
MNSSFPYLEFMNIAKECRSVLINDILSDNASELYDALYDGINRKVLFETKLQLQELMWLELHWKNIEDKINSYSFSERERKRCLSMFIQWYGAFLKKWGYEEFEINFVEERTKILRDIIDVSNNWEEKKKRMSVFFKKGKKEREKKIEEIREGRYKDGKKI